MEETTPLICLCLSLSCIIFLNLITITIFTKSKRHKKVQELIVNSYQVIYGIPRLLPPAKRNAPTKTQTPVQGVYMLDQCEFHFRCVSECVFPPQMDRSDVDDK